MAMETAFEIFELHEAEAPRATTLRWDRWPVPSWEIPEVLMEVAGNLMNSIDRDF